MPVLRDVLATFSVLVDDRPLTKLDKRINLLKDKLARFGTLAAAGFGAAGYAAFQLAKEASSAEEAVNVLEATFKKNSDAVVDWSRVTGKAMQRSEYSLQKAAGDFGKFLRPTLQGTNADIAMMSERLAELGVDLASFHDQEDSEAFMRLFSGLSGETEAVRRLGINISDEALTALNKSRGDTRSVTQLSLAEKTMLRYDKILQDSVDAHGDAARSAHRFQGQLKQLTENLKTIRIELGKKLLPAANAFIKKLMELGKVAVEVWERVEEKTSELRTAVLLLGSAITAYAIKATVAWTAANWHLIASLTHSLSVMALQQGGLLRIASAAGKLALGFLLVEDAITFLRGGDSLIGDFVKWASGMNEPLSLVEGTANRVATAFGNWLSRTHELVVEFGKFIPLLGPVIQAAQALGIIAKGDGKYDPHLVDIDAKERMLNESRSIGFDRAVAAGDTLTAAQQFARPGETPEEALRRAKTDRANLVNTGRAAPIGQDVAEGYLDKKKFDTTKGSVTDEGFLQQLNALSGLAPTTGIKKAQMQANSLAPNFSVTLAAGAIVVNGSGDPEVVAKKVVDGMVEEAFGAVGEAAGEAGVN